jgi:hypothetical protein
MPLVEIVDGLEEGTHSLMSRGPRVERRGRAGGMSTKLLPLRMSVQEGEVECCLGAGHIMKQMQENEFNSSEIFALNPTSSC